MSIFREDLYNGVDLAFNGGFFRYYEVHFPDGEAVELLIAVMKFDIEQEGVAEHCNRFILCAQIKDLSSWVQGLAINKRMAKLRGEQNTHYFFKKFDAIIGQGKQRNIGVSPFCTGQGLTRSVFLSHQKQITQQIRAYIADFHEFNIIIGYLKNSQVVWCEEKKQLDIYASEESKIVKYIEGHIHWMSRKIIPYEQDYNNIEVYFGSTMTELKWKSPPAFEKECAEYENLLKFIEQQQARHSHYINHRKYSLFLKAQKMTAIKNMNQLNWEDIMKVDRLCQQLRTLSPCNISKYYTFNLAENITKAKNYHFQKWIDEIELITQKACSLQEVIDKIQVQSKGDIFMLHFLKAKKAWTQCKFYRALAHLKQAQKYVDEEEDLSVICLEEGRNWEHLCKHKQAYQLYQKCLDIRKNKYGSQHPMCLAPLYNILLLALKEQKHDTIAELRSIIQKIKQNNEIFDLKQYFELCMADIIHGFDTDFKGEQGSQRARRIARNTLSKPQAMKLQCERIPLLQQLTKMTQSKTFVKQIKIMPYCTDIRISYQLINLTNAILSKNHLSEQEQLVLYLNSEKLGTRIYHKFLFLLSHYYEQKGQTPKAIQFTKHLLNGSDIYSEQIILSLKKRYCDLLQKEHLDLQKNSFLSKQNIDTLIKLNQLNCCIQQSFKKRDYARCICLGSEWCTVKKQTRQISKLQDSKIRFLLARAFIEVNALDSAKQIVNTLQFEQKDLLQKLIEDKIMLDYSKKDSDEQCSNDRQSTLQIALNLFKTEPSKNHFLDKLDKILEQGAQKSIVKKIIDLIIVLATKEGQKSLIVSIVHLLLLKHCEDYPRILILLWLSRFRQNFDQLQEYRDFLIMKNRRDQQLDNLLSAFLVNSRLEEDKLQHFQRLWWFQKIKQQLSNMKKRYKLLQKNVAQENIENIEACLYSFALEYQSYFSSDLPQSPILNRLEDIASEMDLQYDYSQ